MKTRYLRVTFYDRSAWDIPADLIAKDRANWYAAKDGFEEGGSEWKEEVKHALNDAYDLEAWAKGDMSWDDLKQSARLVCLPAAVDYASAWSEAACEVVDR